jgi:5-formyltetrahydrofolate cyclo-ligase
MTQVKSQLRKEFLNKRKALPFSFIQESSKKIVARILQSKEFQSVDIISCYHPFRNEVDLLSLSFSNVAQSSRLCKNNISFPRVVKGTEKLDFYAVNSLDDFEKGVFGLMEPKTSLRKIDIENIDLFLVPGVAFTKSGLRLGYGGGYYDETLKFRKPASLAFGVCFDIQLTDLLPSEEWDIRMDFIVTESGICKAN